MLRVDLRAATVAPVETSAEVPPGDAALQELEVRPTRPILVTGRMLASGPGSYYWDGRVRTQVELACRRCLTLVTLDIDDAVRLLFTEDEDNDDPAAVQIPRHAADLELGDMVREALVLAIPEYPVCREDCRGMCPRCGADWNQGPCGCTPQRDARWDALRSLRQHAPDDEAR